MWSLRMAGWMDGVVDGLKVGRSGLLTTDEADAIAVRTHWPPSRTA
jgi:hypothetical protein